MIRILFYYLLLLAVVSVAFRRGDRETRFAACICVAASVLSALLMTFHTQVAVGVAVVDLSVLGLFVALALRTERFWPLWIAGLQLTTVLGHLLRLLQPGLVNFAYAAAMRFWAYPILLILMAAAIRSERYSRPEPLPSA
jgi:hypothetical protein